eukprot:g36378.t1
MFEYFTENVETIADGIWHLQKVDDFPAMFRWISAKCAMAIPGVGNATGPPPTAEAVRRVMKRDWSFVREMRIGEYGICICLELQERRDDGFRTDRDAEEWKAAIVNALHHKIHQTNRKAHVCRTHQAAVCPQWLSCYTIDMSKPVYIPSCRRVTDQLKGKHVMQLNWGGSISFGCKTEYILVHGPGIKHGVNENLSFLYHILRANMFNPRTMAADHLDLEIDGACDNVATAAQMFYCHLCKVGWKCTVCTNRMCRHHTHNIQDQRHHVTRYFGWNKCFTTANLAQGLYQMLLGYRNSAQRVVILLLEKNYDWETYFSPCVNPNGNIKYAGKPLHWKYVQSPVEGGMPTEYKQWGDVNAHWCGEGGVPGALCSLCTSRNQSCLARLSCHLCIGLPTNRGRT